jgi:hypothetical protein
MTVEELAKRLGAEVLGCEGTDLEIQAVYGADRVSDLLVGASPTTLLVTNLAGPQILRVAELMEAPAICLVNGQAPGADVVARAKACGVALLLSSGEVRDVCARVKDLLGSESQADA